MIGGKIQARGEGVVCTRKWIRGKSIEAWFKEQI